ncbi:hypothetical protein F4778DRAFT_761210 [Xylariomycetidae sp. FL2044]|nr:hypothetical protein F4778DRAFT_761210 [Xylariomycetidae sp. FL2044]
MFPTTPISPGNPATTSKPATSQQLADTVGSLELEGLLDTKTIGVEKAMSEIPDDVNSIWLQLTPPPLYQAYCKKHFLGECCKWYYIIMTHSFANLIKEASEPALSRAGSRAGSVSRLGSMSASSTSSFVGHRKPNQRRSATRSSSRKGSTAALEDSPEEQLRKQALGQLLTLRQHLDLTATWGQYQKHFESQLDKLLTQLGEEDALGEEVKTSCVLSSNSPPECPYCSADATEGENAPPVSTDAVSPDMIHADQRATCAGITFALDTCGDEPRIVLLDMAGCEDVSSANVEADDSDESESEQVVHVPRNEVIKTEKRKAVSSVAFREYRAARAKRSKGKH